MERTDRTFEVVEFPSEGARCGAVSTGLDPRPAAVVLIVHGTSATITMVTDRYAEVFQDAGLAVLLYDHRNFGDSGGEPRQEINPWVQARGYRDAVTFVQSLDGVDHGRIALWGDSYSAAEVVVVGAVDDRLPPSSPRCRRADRLSPRRTPTAPSSLFFERLCSRAMSVADRATPRGPCRWSPRTS